MSLDELRAFFDERNTGKLSETHPLQSALLSSLYLDDDESESFIESSMMRLFPPQSISWPLVDDSSIITATILKNLHDSSGECHYSIYDGIELATDILYISDDSSESEVEERAKAFTFSEKLSEVIAPIPPSAPIIVKKSSRTSSTQTDPPAVIIEEIVPGAKKGSFQSGKDKFLQDVSVVTRLMLTISLNSNFDDKN